MKNKNKKIWIIAGIFILLIISILCLAFGIAEMREEGGKCVLNPLSFAEKSFNDPGVKCSCSKGGYPELNFSIS